MGLREAARALAGDRAALSGATVLLLSDGHANAGIVDPAQLADLAAKAQRGAAPTTTSTLGLGQRYDEVILTALARGGSGEHRYAPDTDAASAEFGGLVEDLLGKSVTGALLRVLPRPAALVAGATTGPDGRASGAVDRIVVHGSLPSWPDGDAVVVNLGDLYGGEERQVLVTLGVPALAAVGTATLAELELAYTSLPDLRVHTVTLPVSVNVVPGDEARGRVPDARVSVARLLLDADEVKRTAADRLRAGDEEAARATLSAAIGRVRGSRDLAGADEALAERIDAAVADLEEVERSTRERTAAYASKLAMESWNQTSRGKQRRRSRFVDEGFADVGGVPVDRGVLLAQGDIVAFARSARCDAIVSAANPTLIGGAGVAGAILAAGGDELLRACAGHVAANGALPVGEAVTTRGYGVGVPWVVHAVGPRYGIDLPSDELLAAAHRRAVEEADALGCATLAVPAISTGVFGYPVDEAAPVALRAVEEALTRCVTLREVTFVLSDAVTHAAYRSAAAGV
jgi:Ca-activated chloride channel family protein